MNNPKENFPLKRKNPNLSTNQYPYFDENGNSFFYEVDPTDSFSSQELNETLLGDSSKEIWKDLFKIVFAYENILETFNNLALLYQPATNTSGFIRTTTPRLLNPGNINALFECEEFRNEFVAMLKKQKEKSNTLDGNLCNWDEAFLTATNSIGEKFLNFDSNKVNTEILPEKEDITQLDKLFMYGIGFTAGAIGKRINATQPFSPQTFTLARCMIQKIRCFYKSQNVGGKTPPIENMIDQIVDAPTFQSWVEETVASATQKSGSLLSPTKEPSERQYSDNQF